MEKIDFVILWVDGNDPRWLQEKQNYQPKLKNNENNSISRFRDWENLQYWFRMVEKNASWVNNIFFITWGHTPSWLNKGNPKLKIIKHEDYIPAEYLPTYNSNVIELNLFRIKELSENFVLFNDDTFIIEKTKKSDFFKNGYPCDCYSEVINQHTNMNDIYCHNMLNNMCIINKYFKKRKMYLKHPLKYFNLKYSIKENLHNILMLAYSSFSLIENKHLPVSLKKSTIKKLWEMEYDNLHKCCLNRFRNFNDISQCLVRFIQICSGNFIPRKSNYGMYFVLDDSNKKTIKVLEKKKYKIVCFNDTNEHLNFEESKQSLNSYLDSRYKEKSSFEK